MAMGMNVVRLATYRRDAIIGKVVSLDTPVHGEDHIRFYDVIPAKGEDVMHALQSKEAKHILQQEIEKLSARERQTIQLYYFQKKNLKQIGKELGITESRACQIRSAAVGSLRMRMRRAFLK